MGGRELLGGTARAQADGGERKEGEREEGGRGRMTGASGGVLAASRTCVDGAERTALGLVSRAWVGCLANLDAKETLGVWELLCGTRRAALSSDCLACRWQINLPVSPTVRLSHGVPAESSWITAVLRGGGRDTPSAGSVCAPTAGETIGPHSVWGGSEKREGATRPMMVEEG